MRKTFLALWPFAALLLSSPAARARDHVRIGATATLANAGSFGGMSIFSTTDDPDGAKPEGLGLFCAKLGVLARF